MLPLAPATCLAWAAARLHGEAEVAAADEACDAAPGLAPRRWPPSPRLGTAPRGKRGLLAEPLEAAPSDFRTGRVCCCSPPPPPLPLPPLLPLATAPELALPPNEGRWPRSRGVDDTCGGGAPSFLHPTVVEGELPGIRLTGDADSDTTLGVPGAAVGVPGAGEALGDPAPPPPPRIGRRAEFGIVEQGGGTADDAAECRRCFSGEAEAPPAPEKPKLGERCRREAGGEGLSDLLGDGESIVSRCITAASCAAGAVAEHGKNCPSSVEPVDGDIGRHCGEAGACCTMTAPGLHCEDVGTACDGEAAVGDLLCTAPGGNCGETI